MKKIPHAIMLAIGGISMVIAMAMFFDAPKPLQADTPVTNLSGYAWSDTIGWISFDTVTNGGNGVAVDENGYLNGYAWSEHIGWIKFGGFSEFPAGDGTFADNARIDESGMTGWIRACAGTFDGECEGATHEYTPPPIPYQATEYYWQERYPAGSETMTSSKYDITTSSNGKKVAVIAADIPVVLGNFPKIFTSSNSGSSWTEAGAPAKPWTDIAYSADGSRLSAVESSPSYNWGDDRYAKGYVYTSADSGATWTQRTSAGQRFWISIASTADGTKLAAADTNTGNSEKGYLYTSADSGATWTQRTSAGLRFWSSVAYSEDGAKLVAVGGDTTTAGHIYVSSDGGATWTEGPSTGSIFTSLGARKEASISSNGTKMVIVTSDRVLASTNGGSSWSYISDTSKAWEHAAISGDGTKIFASAATYSAFSSTWYWGVFISSNFGSSWQSTTLPSLRQGTTGTGIGDYGPIASSADGNNVYVITNYQNGWEGYVSTGIIGEVLIDQEPIIGDSRSDGWDGWISLSGSSPSYGITYNGVSNTFNGYAWGSDVVGWIDFSQVRNGCALGEQLVNGVCQPANGYCTSDATVAQECLQPDVPACVQLSCVNNQCTYSQASPLPETCSICPVVKINRSLNPSLVPNPDSTCTLSWNVYSARTAADPSGLTCDQNVLTPSSCTLDSATVATSSAGTSVSVGTHTLRCTDVNDHTAVSVVQCKVSPSYGEF